MKSGYLKYYDRYSGLANLRFLWDALWTHSKVAKLSLANRQRDYLKLNGHDDLLALHRAINEELLEATRRGRRYAVVQQLTTEHRWGEAVAAAEEFLDAYSDSLEAQTLQVEIQTGYPPLVNDRGIMAVADRVAREVVGEEDVWEGEPMMGAEDFAILAREAPGAFLWVGAACTDPREHHNPRFDIDESVLPINAALLAGMATELLKNHG